MGHISVACPFFFLSGSVMLGGPAVMVSSRFVMERGVAVVRRLAALARDLTLLLWVHCGEAALTVLPSHVQTPSW
jgi:hypothetical protein